MDGNLLFYPGLFITFFVCPKIFITFEAIVVRAFLIWITSSYSIFKVSKVRRHITRGSNDQLRIQICGLGHDEDDLQTKILASKAPCFHDVRAAQKLYFPCCFPYDWCFPKLCITMEHLGSIVLPHPKANKDNVHQFQQIGESIQTWFLRCNREIMQLFYRRPFIYLAMDWLSHHTKLCYKGVTNTPGKCWFARTFTGLSVCHCKNWDTVTVTS